MPDPGQASLGVSWVGHLRVCNSHGGAAPGRASEAGGCPLAGRDRHRDPLHTDQWFLSTFARSQCTRNARGRARRMRRDASAPVDCAASQASSVSRGGAPAAPCIASPRATANASFPSVSSIEVKCNRSCPNGKVQLLHLVKVARVVSGGKNQSGKVAPRAKGQLPLRLRQCEPDLVLTGLTRLLQIETDFMDGRAIFLH